MVDRVRYFPPVLGELFVCLHGWAGRDFALQPFGEGRLLCYLPCGFEAGDEGLGIVVLGVGEVAEIEGGLDGGVRGGEEDSSSGAGTRDVGRHAESV